MINSYFPGLLLATKHSNHDREQMFTDVGPYSLGEFTKPQMSAEFVRLLVKCKAKPSSLTLNGIQTILEFKGGGLSQLSLIIETMGNPLVTEEVSLVFKQSKLRN